MKAKTNADLEQKLKKSEDARKKAEDDAKAADDARKKAEDDARAAEDARKKAEDEKEKARIKAEEDAKQGATPLAPFALVIFILAVLFVKMKI